LPNLLLAFPDAPVETLLPWIDVEAATRSGRTPEAAATEIGTSLRAGWASSGLTSEDVRALRDSIAPRVITPGSTSGEPLHLLSSLERRSALWDHDEEGAHD